MSLFKRRLVINAKTHTPPDDDMRRDSA